MILYAYMFWFAILFAVHNEQGILNDYIREKLNDENCAIILMENPPYSESGSSGTQNTKKKTILDSGRKADKKNPSLHTNMLI